MFSFLSSPLDLQGQSGKIIPVLTIISLPPCGILQQPHCLWLTSHACVCLCVCVSALMGHILSTMGKSHFFLLFVIVPQESRKVPFLVDYQMLMNSAPPSLCPFLLLFLLLLLFLPFLPSSSSSSKGATN